MSYSYLFPFGELISLIRGTGSTAPTGPVSTLPPLPRDIWCSVIQQITTLPVIVRLLRTQRRFRDILLDCIQVIRVDPQHPDQLVPVEFILPFRNLRYVELDIYVNSELDLIALAQKPITYYRLILGPEFGEGFEPPSYLRFVRGIRTFITHVGSRPLTYLSFQQYFLRPGSSFLSRFLRRMNVIEFPPIFILDNGLLQTNINLYLPQVADETLEVIRMVGPRLTAFEAPRGATIGGQLDLNIFLRLLNILNTFPNLETIVINVILAVNQIPYYLQTLPQLDYVDSLVVAREKSGLLSRQLFPQAAQATEGFLRLLVNTNRRTDRPVEIQLPLTAASIPLLLQVFPNAKVIGVLEPADLRALLNNYPDIQFEVFTNNPTFYKDITDPRVTFSPY